MIRRTVFCLLFCLLSGWISAQSETMLTGKIVDSAGESLSGCRIKVCDCEKQDSSDKDGVYRIFLKPGRYELQVFRSGSMFRRRTVDIPPADFYEVDFTLTGYQRFNQR